MYTGVSGLKIENKYYWPMRGQYYWPMRSSPGRGGWGRGPWRCPGAGRRGSEPAPGPPLSWCYSAWSASCTWDENMLTRQSSLGSVCPTKEAKRDRLRKTGWERERWRLSKRDLVKRNLCLDPWENKPFQAQLLLHLLGVEAADDNGGQEGHDPDEHSDDEDEDLHPADTGGCPHLKFTEIYCHCPFSDI